VNPLKLTKLALPTTAILAGASAGFLGGCGYFWWDKSRDPWLIRTMIALVVALLLHWVFGFFRRWSSRLSLRAWFGAKGQLLIWACYAIGLGAGLWIVFTQLGR
jgi:hypothetical protein